jgi:hypothetical protein
MVRALVLSLCPSPTVHRLGGHERGPPASPRRSCSTAGPVSSSSSGRIEVSGASSDSAAARVPGIRGVQVPPDSSRVSSLFFLCN